jgi:hypothetical protein
MAFLLKLYEAFLIKLYDEDQGCVKQIIDCNLYCTNSRHPLGNLLCESALIVMKQYNLQMKRYMMITRTSIRVFFLKFHFSREIWYCAIQVGGF